MVSLEQKIQTGAVWMVLFKLTERSLGLISTVVLARLLVPEDFGLVAMASVVIAFLELLSAFGFDMALIQNQEAGRAQFDTVWTFNVLFGLMKAVILVLIAVPVSRFYEEPRLVLVFLVLASGLLIGGLENVGIVAFRKDLRFSREFQYQVTKKLASFIVTVSLALFLRTYWALIAGVLTWQISGVVLSNLLHPYRPRLSLSAKQEVIGFSKWLLLNNFVSFFYLHSAHLIIGKISGARPLGLYTVAYEISNLPTTELIAPINRAIFPGYAKMASDLENLRDGFLKIISVIALLALPAAAGIAVTAELLVTVVFGDKWLDAVPLIQVLAFYGAITALETNTYYIHLALGNVRAFTMLIAISAVLLVVLGVALTIRWGALGAAVAYLIVAIMFFPLFYGAVMRKLKLRARAIALFLWRPVVAASIMYAIVRLALQSWGAVGAAEEVVQLATVVLLGVGTYSTMVLVLWSLAGKPIGPERYVLNKLALVLAFRER